MKFVSVFSAFLLLFEAISKNLPRIHINLHCLIQICLENLLSISSLHRHTGVLLYWYLSELRPIMQTILQDSCIHSTAFEIHRVYHIHENHPSPNCILFQDVWFLRFSMLSRVKCVPVVISWQQQDPTHKVLSPNSTVHLNTKVASLHSHWTSYLCTVTHRIKRAIMWTKSIRHFAGLILLCNSRFKLIQLLLFYFEFKIGFCHWSGNFPKILQSFIWPLTAMSFKDINF